MVIKTTPIFERAFRGLSPADQQLVRETVLFFRESPNHESLRNHLLETPMSGKRSISVRDDLRIIFIERGGYIQVLMLDVGDHETAYVS